MGISLPLHDAKYNHRLYLPNITIVIIDCIMHARARRVLQHCINLCEFGDAKFFTDIQDAGDYIVPIKKIESKEGYSNFIMKEMVNYITTDFILIVQVDGFIVNPKGWDSNFLRYDYIGAPWHPKQLQETANLTYLVGNGGFSLRSRKLHEFIRDDATITQLHPEDVSICQKYRGYLEDNGFKFPPVHVAHGFSCENTIWNGAFGHHNYFLLHPLR